MTRRQSVVVASALAAALLGATLATAGDAGAATLRVGIQDDPDALDPALSGTYTGRFVFASLCDKLVDISPDLKIVPQLAESWEWAPDGRSITFKLRRGVTFHDGTPFDAEAACANFDRMFDQNEVGRSAAYYWGATFGAFADDASNSLYQGCEPTGEHELVMTISRVTSKFPAILSLTSFGMQSPTALEEGDANNITQSGEAFAYPENANNPVGTGPYVFGGYDEATRTVTLDRNEEYWGEPAKTEQIVIRAIPDESTRRQELQAGGIDGYDFPNPVDWQGLQDEGNQVEVRPAFNVLYLALNPTNNEALTDLRVRQAIYHAINREQLVQSQLPEGAAVATQFMPDTVDGYNSELEPYAYDPEQAQALLAEAGQEDLTITFAYPTEVTRPYMPDPAKLYDAIKADLEAVGITVETVTDPWATYLDKAYTEYDAHFLGWTGDINSADNFLASFFGNVERNRFATNLQDFGTELGDEIVAADGILDEAERTAAYEALNQRIMEEWLPGLPISHSPPAIVVSDDVSGLVPSPLTAERFDTIEVAGGN